MINITEGNCKDTGNKYIKASCTGGYGMSAGGNWQICTYKKRLVVDHSVNLC